MFTKTLIGLATATGVVLTAAPAVASDKGLYGAGDPTYDGVYRQSLSIMALTASDQKLPKSAVAWLKSQQCKDGGFVEYRPSASDPCPAQDPANFAGRDLNGTAMAVAALELVGERKAARKAVRWILSQQAADGGWAYFPGPGATSDGASSALAVGAAQLVGRKAQATFLRKVQYGCTTKAAERGGIKLYADDSTPNNGASAQTAWALGTGMSVPAGRKISKKAPATGCGSAAKKPPLDRGALHHVYQQLLAQGGALPYGGGYPGTDYSSTASAGLALAYAGIGRKAVNKTSRFLQKDAETWISGAGDDAPGSLALLILFAEATGENPKKFAGMNLIQRLAKTQR